MCSYCCLLINRVLSSLPKNKTPYEILHQKMVDYSIFKVFGCLAFASTLPAQRTKFDPRARACVFFGYPTRMKGYKLYDIQTQQFLLPKMLYFMKRLSHFTQLLVQTLWWILFPILFCLSHPRVCFLIIKSLILLHPNLLIYMILPPQSITVPPSPSS